jgi:hypothetical protein
LNTANRLNSLAHIPLIKSPFLRVPVAVTLPYDHVQLPSPQSIAPPPIFKHDAAVDYTQEQARYNTAKKTAAVWQEQVEQRRLQRARRLAPGFLDTGVTLLTPMKSGVMQSAAAPAPKKEDDAFKDYFEGLTF